MAVRPSVRGPFGLDHIGKHKNQVPEYLAKTLLGFGWNFCRSARYRGSHGPLVLCHKIINPLSSSRAQVGERSRKSLRLTI